MTEDFKITGSRRYATDGVVRPDGSRSHRYTSVTNYTKPIQNTWYFERRAIAYAMRGTLDADDEMLRMMREVYDQDIALAKLGDSVARNAGAWTAADNGTRMHGYTEQYDRGQLHIRDVADDSDRRDLLAYAAATHGLRYTHIEQMVINDDLEYVGTADRFGHWESGYLPESAEPGKDYALDLKTSQSLDKGYLALSAQLAAYANADLYDETPTRRYNRVDKTRGFVIWLPYGHGVCKIFPVEYRWGWRAIEAASEVYVIRGKHKAAMLGKDEVRWTVPETRYLVDIGQATSLGTLLDLHSVGVMRGEWTDELSAAARRRLDTIG